MANLFIKGSASSYIGVSRPNNEDNYFLNGKFAKYEVYDQNSTAFQSSVKNGVFGVFDGMGGQSEGEFASLCAVKTLSKYKQDMIDNGYDIINYYIYDVNQQICNEMERINKHIGSTLAILTINDGIARAYNLGDSCIYHISKNKVTKLSRDHTVAEQLYRKNLLTKEEAKRDIRRHRLTRHLGILTNKEYLKPYISQNVEFINGDMFLLCTDGVSDCLNETDIKEIMYKSDGKCKKAVDNIIEKAIEKGSQDNITAIVLRVVKNKNKNSIFSKFDIDEHPHIYSFLLGVGVSAIFFIIILIILFL